MGFVGELGTALGGLALLQHTLKQEEQAWESLQEALHITVEIHGRVTLFTLAAALVVMLVDASSWEQAVEAYAALMTDPIVANSRWFADMVGERMEIVRKHLSESVCQAADARARRGDLFAVLGRLEQEIKAWGLATIGEPLD